MIEEFDVFELTEDINPIITKGMQGVCLQVYQDEILVEFVKEDGTNYKYEGQDTFTIKKDIVNVTWRSNEK